MLSLRPSLGWCLAAFAEWLDKWIDGRPYQPTLVQDEATGRWRGATDAEMERWTAEV